MIELAGESGLDVDEALIRLWDAGLERYADPTDRVVRRDVDVARKALSIPTRRQLTSPEYWKDILGMDDQMFRALLADLNVPMTAQARTLPKGAIAKLRRHTLSVARGPAYEEEPGEEPLDDDALEWRVLGHHKKLCLLSEGEVLAIHDELVRDFAQDDDPIDPPGMRSDDLLASAVFRSTRASAMK